MKERKCEQPEKNNSEYLLRERLVHNWSIDYVQMEKFAADPLIISKADGVWLEDIRGRKILDAAASTSGVVILGHGNQRVNQAITEQLQKFAHGPVLESTNIPAMDLTKLLGDITPGDLNTVKLYNSGSEATESAMQLARQYHKQSGNPSKFKMISRYMSFHGHTFGAAAATGWRSGGSAKWVFEPFPAGFIHVMPPHCYRCPYGLTYPSCDVLCAKIIRNIVEYEAPETVAAIIVDPICAPIGFAIPPDEYFAILRQICDEFKILLIFDEVITGIGRTGQMFAAQTFHTTPDIICIAKGMASGYAPISAMIVSDRIAAAFLDPQDDSRAFMTGSTYGGNPVSCAAAIACIREVIDRDLCRRSREMGQYLQSALERLQPLGIVGQIRGKGMMVAVEFVKNPQTKQPFPKETQIGLRIGLRALKKGLLTRYRYDWIEFTPPLTISKEEIDQVVDTVFESAREVIGELGK